MATQKTPTKKKSQQNDDDSTLKWIAIGGLAAILVGGTVLGLVAAVLNSDSSPRTAQTQQTDAAKKKDDKKKKDDEKEKNRAKEEQKAKEAKAREEQQKKENDAKFEEWYKKGEDKFKLATEDKTLDKSSKISIINSAISCFEKALEYAQSNLQKHRASFGAAVSYNAKKELSSLSNQEKGQWGQSAKNALDFAVTNQEKEQAHTGCASFYSQNGMYRDAITEWTEASNCALQDENNKSKGVLYLIAPGMIALKDLQDVDMAKSLFQRGLELSENLPQKESIARPMFLTCLAMVAAVEGNKPKEIRLLKLARQDNEAVASQIVKANYPEVKRIYNLPSKSPQNNTNSIVSEEGVSNLNEALSYINNIKNMERNEREQMRRKIYEENGVDIAKIDPRW